jgi:adenosylcobinamide-GDP ribazoletransferase
MLHELRLFFVALQSLTRVPLPGWVGWQPEWLNDCTRHFPAVGLCVGAFGSMVLWAGAHWWPALPAVLLALAASAWLTGALHEHGLGATCEALGGSGSGSRERALAALQDNRLGSHGVVGLLFVLALKAAALHGLAVRDLAAALVLLPLAQAWSRCVMVLLMRWLPPVGTKLLQPAAAALARVDGSAAAVALMWVGVSALAATPFVSGAVLLTAALAALGATLGMARWLQQRLGGCTAQTLGAAQQFSELAVLLAALAVMTRG